MIGRVGEAGAVRVGGVWCVFPFWRVVDKGRRG